MNTNAAWSNVVAMPIQHCAEADGPGARRSDAALARATVSQFRKGIELLCEPVFERIDDLLFSLAERAPDAALQQGYMDGMRDLRRNRKAFLDSFGNHIQRAAEQIGLWAGGDARRSGAEPDLSLVGEDHLERTLALRSMASSTERQFSAVLDRLGARLAKLGGLEAIGQRELPFGPHAMSKAMDHALRVFSIDLNTQLIFLKLFEKHVVRRLDRVYNGIDATLVRAGVVGGEANHDARRPTMPHVASSAPKGAHPNPAPVRRGARWAGAARHELAAASMQRSAAGVRPEAPLSTAELIRALGVIQASVSPDDEARRESLRQLLRRQTGDRPLQSSQDQAIGKVQTLFDYVVQDDSLDASLKTGLLRLQVPFTKLALVDPSFFQRRNHPAWQLLNELVRVGMELRKASVRQDATGAGNSFTKLGRLRAAIDHAIQRVLSEFSSDVGQIGEILDELVSVVEKIERRGNVRAGLDARPSSATKPAASSASYRTVAGRQATEDRPAAAASPPSGGSSRDVSPMLNETYLRQASRLPEGIWMHYKMIEGGASTRVRLSWRSPLNRRNLFVDSRGFKALELSLQELADYLRAGRLKLLA